MSMINKLILFTAVLAFVGWSVLSRYYSNERDSLRTQYNQQVISLRSKWNEERRIRKINHHEELKLAWGEGMSAVVKDPTLTIADMLREAASVASPDAMRAEVKSDNFTEFDVFIHENNPTDKNTAASIVKTLLCVCGRYVNSISFVYDNEVVMKIDLRVIDAVEDWASVDLASVADQLHEP